MNRLNILARLASGEFDMHYLSAKYSDGKADYRLEYEIKDGEITKRKLSGGRVTETVTYTTDDDKITFIRQHPYWFPYDEDFG